MDSHSPIGLDTPYWNSLDNDQLSLPRCGGCGRWQWPAVARCGECGHWGSDWQDVAIQGRIFSWTRTAHRFGGTEGLPLPFVSLLVEIDGTDGKRLMGLLDGADQNGAIQIGTAVIGRIGSTSYGEEQVPVILWRMQNEGKA